MKRAEARETRIKEAGDAHEADRTRSKRRKHRRESQQRTHTVENRSNREEADRTEIQPARNCKRRHSNRFGHQNPKPKGIRSNRTSS